MQASFYHPSPPLPAFRMYCFNFPDNLTRSLLLAVPTVRRVSIPNSLVPHTIAHRCFHTQSAHYIFTHLFTVYALPHNVIALDIISHSRPDSQIPLAPYAVTCCRSQSHRCIRSMPMLRSPFHCMIMARRWQFRTSHELSPECFQVFSLPKAERKT